MPVTKTLLTLPDVFPPRPPKARVDHVGKKFQRLTVVGYGGVRNQESLWWCRCDCGGISRPTGRMLVTGGVKSCGCLNREKRLAAVTTHGYSKREDSPEYQVWHGMKQRCINKNNRAYKNYGGRGITVYPEWSADFLVFLKDVGPRPSSDHSLDRINNNGNYEPGNVRWATRKEQSNNRRPPLGGAKSWKPMTSAPKTGDLLLYMGVNVAAGSCYWNRARNRWCDPDRPGQEIRPAWWATLPTAWVKA